jgi:hypothetical protein
MILFKCFLGFSCRNSKKKISLKDNLIFLGELSVGQTRRRIYEEPEISGAVPGNNRMENSVASSVKQQLQVELNNSNLQVLTF